MLTQGALIRERKEIRDFDARGFFKGGEDSPLQTQTDQTNPRSRPTQKQRRTKDWSDAIKFAGLKKAELDKLTKEILAGMRS